MQKNSFIPVISALLLFFASCQKSPQAKPDEKQNHKLLIEERIGTTGGQKFFYDDKDRLIKVLGYHEIFNDTLILKYDNANRVTEAYINYIRPDGRVYLGDKQKERFTYLSQDSIKVDLYINKYTENTLVSTEFYYILILNNKQQIIREYVNYPPPLEDYPPPLSRSFEYDAKGNIIKITHYTDHAAVLGTENYTYDDQKSPFTNALGANVLLDSFFWVSEFAHPTTYINNPVLRKMDNYGPGLNDEVPYKYTYAADGLPTSFTKIEHGKSIDVQFIYSGQ